MKITLDMSISKLLDAFDREFGVSLGIYKGAHKSDNIKLFEISDPRKNQKAFIVINKDMKETIRYITIIINIENKIFPITESNLTVFDSFC